MKPRAILSGFALLATLVAVGYGFETGAFGAMLEERWIDRVVRGHRRQSSDGVLCKT